MDRWLVTTEPGSPSLLSKLVVSSGSGNSINEIGADLVLRCRPDVFDFWINFDFNGWQVPGRLGSLLDHSADELFAG